MREEPDPQGPQLVHPIYAWMEDRVGAHPRPEDHDETLWTVWLLCGLNGAISGGDVPRMCALPLDAPVGEREVQRALRRIGAAEEAQLVRSMCPGLRRLFAEAEHLVLEPDSLATACEMPRVTLVTLDPERELMDELRRLDDDDVAGWAAFSALVDALQAARAEAEYARRPTERLSAASARFRWAARLFAHWVGGRLPSEAEWEYACRAGSGGEWCFGSDEAQLADFAWYARNAFGATHPVGGKTANALGLHDMHGNVLEWCDDWFGAFSTEPRRDPEGPAHGSRRVLRGGASRASAQACRSAYRSRFDPSVRETFVGFRVALPEI